MLRKLVFLSAMGLLLTLLSPVQAQDGKVLFEFWFGGITDQVETLLADGRYPYGPDLTEYMDSFTADRPADDYYGGRGRAYLTPPETGDYTIWVWSDDDSLVYLSPDENPDNAELVASVAGWTGANEWTKYPSQKGAPKALEAGKRYYLEGVYADGTGGGNIGVGWTGPGIGDAPVIIAGQYLSAFVVTRHPAYKPDPASGAVDVTTQLFQWTAGVGAAAHDIYFGTDPNFGPDTFKGRVTWAMHYAQDPLTPGAKYFWRVDEVSADGVVSTGDTWTFTVQPLIAHFPSPADGALWVPAALTASWAPGQNAKSYTVYGAPIKDAVVAGLDAAKLGVTEETSFDATGLLEPATVYYWRVDTTDNSDVVHPGDVWTFSTFDPKGGAIAEYWDNMTLSGAPKVVTTVGTINFDWGDGAAQGVNSPDPNIPTNLFSCRWTAQLNVPTTGKYVIYEASDDGARTFLNGQQICAGWVDRGTTEDASAELDLVAGQPYLLVMEMYENGGGATAFLRWSGPGIAKSIIPQGALIPPKMAYSPSPANGADKLEANKIVLGWTAGAGATVHTVYLGTDPNLVAASDASTLQGVAPTTGFTPTGIAWETKYYWKVDEMAADGTITPGLVWSFTTGEAVATDPAAWEVFAVAADPTFLATNVENGTYDIGTYGGEQTYEFLVKSNPAETMTSMALIGRLNFGDTKAGLKFEQWENTGTYGATLFGVADYDFKVANNPGIPTDIVFISSTAANKTSLYINGVFQASLDTVISLSGQVGIGRAIRADGTFVDDFDGKIVAVAIYDRALSVGELRAHADAYFMKGPSDITAPTDAIKGIPYSDVCGGDANVNVSPCKELPPGVIDNSKDTKYLNFKGDFDAGETASGFVVTPALGATVVTGMTFTSANDSANRDPVKFELYGSNESIDGPFTLIASGDIVDFAQATEWPRKTINATPITFKNKTAYKHYQVLFTAIRDPATANSMQIAEVELIGVPEIVMFSEGFEAYAADSQMHGQGGWKGWDNAAGATAPVSAEQAASGVNSVKIIGSSDLVHEFTVKGGVWEFSAKQYIPTGAAGTTDFILMNQYKDGNPGSYDDWSDQTEFRMDAGVVHFADGQEAPLVRDKWVEVKYIIDLNNNTVDRYYDGVLIGSGQWDDSVHGTFQAVDLFGNSASPIYYDDITLR